MPSKKKKELNNKKKVVIGSSQPIRVLHYIGSLDIGGSQTMVLNIYHNIDRSKVQFDFVVDKKNELFFKEEIESLGGRVFIFDKSFNGFNYALFTRQWKNFFKDHPEYKLLHCHVRSVASIVLRIAKKSGLRTICHSHNTSNGSGIKSVVKKFLQSRIKSDYYFACSKEAAEWLYGHRIASSRNCFVINNAIEVDKYRFSQNNRDEIRRKYAIDDDSFLVGHVGRFEKQKNHDFIFELIKNCDDESIKFMLCGDGSLKLSFQNRIKMEGLSDRVFYVAGTDEINKYYSAFDYFILPSLYEGLGMVLIEAQYSGLNCLVSPNVPDEAKITNNYKVTELSLSKWEEIIAYKKQNSVRNKVRLLPIAKKYDVEKTAKMLERLYMDFFKEHKEVE